MRWTRLLVVGLDTVTSRVAGIDGAAANAANELQRTRLETARVDAAVRRAVARGRVAPVAAA